MRGLSQSIDFTGGRNFKVQFENPVEPEQIRELISSKFGDANVSARFPELHLNHLNSDVPNISPYS